LECELFGSAAIHRRYARPAVISQRPSQLRVRLIGIAIDRNYYVELPDLFETSTG
jgi:hypothetical protein